MLAPMINGVIGSMLLVGNPAAFRDAAGVTGTTPNLGRRGEVRFLRMGHLLLWPTERAGSASNLAVVQGPSFNVRFGGRKRCHLPSVIMTTKCQ